MIEIGLILTDEHGNRIQINEDSFLIFIDETGVESLNDHNYPIFGIGGCGVLAKHYYSKIVLPWKDLKEREFDGSENPLHATGLKPNKSQIDSLNSFFIQSCFARMAVVISDKTKFKIRADVYAIAALDFPYRIKNILENTHFSEIIFIFESSQRTDYLTTKYFDNLRLMKEYPNGKVINVKLHKFRMKKEYNEPGLEVADFIINAAGTTVRDKLNGKINEYIDRKDFNNIFNKAGLKLASFLEIKEVKNNK
ncbi:DUF3800 domain-containing protein [bacterium]|nr:DUF3800 domain-containing protein [bacterium]